MDSRQDLGHSGQLEFCSSLPTAGWSMGPRQATNASYSNFFGYQAGTNLTGTSDNIAIGRGAAYRAAAFSVTSGIFIGGNCTTNGTAVTNVIGLGNDITLTTSNTVVIGNSSQNIGIGGLVNPSYKLDVSGGGRFTSSVYVNADELSSVLQNQIFS